VSAIRTRLCREDVTEVMAPTRAMSLGVAISPPICPVAMRNGAILEVISKVAEESPERSRISFACAENSGMHNGS